MDMAEKNDADVLPNKRINSFFFFIKNGAQGPSELRVLVLCFVAKAYPLECKFQPTLAYMTGVITVTNPYYIEKLGLAKLNALINRPITMTVNNNN